MAVNLYSSGQRGGRGQPKKKSPWLWMIQDQAAQGQATQGITNKMQTDLAERRRVEDNTMWQKSHNLSLASQRRQDKSAQTAMGMGIGKLGLNAYGKFSGFGKVAGGSAGNKWYSGSMGGAGAGAMMGYGLANIFGDKSKKNKAAGTLLGGLAGYFF